MHAYIINPGGQSSDSCVRALQFTLSQEWRRVQTVPIDDYTFYMFADPDEQALPEAERDPHGWLKASLSNNLLTVWLAVDDEWTWALVTRLRNQLGDNG